MASADVASPSSSSSAAPDARPPPLDDSPTSSPHSSVVYSTTSTTALTLDGLSRQNSATTILGLDDPEHEKLPPSSNHDQQTQHGTGIHRVASEQLLPTASDLTASALLATNAARASSMVVGKVTSRRRQRNPRRFVVTELPPEHDDFLSDPTPTSSPPPMPTVITSDLATGEARANTIDSTTVTPYRPSKMEVRGRFTIIDLSPDSPAANAHAIGEASSLTPPSGSSSDMPRATRLNGASSNGTSNGNGAASRMRRALPPRRFSRGEKSSSMTMTMASAPPALPESSVLTAAMLRGQEDHTGSGYGSGHHFDMSRRHSHSHSAFSPKTPQLSPHGVDLNALDRHLVFLQQESLDMKAVLESMISSNARWISALSSSSSSSDGNVGSGKNPKAVHPTTSPLACTTNRSPRAPPVVVIPPPVVVIHEPTLEEKYEKLLMAHTELQQHHETLSTEAAQLKRTNLLLETRLRQETSVNGELRAHVDQLTQYTESLIYSAGEPPPSRQSDRPRRKQTLSTSSADVALENGVHATTLQVTGAAQTQEPTGPGGPSSASRSVPTPHNRHHSRTISEVSVDSSAAWALENNQFHLDDDDDSNLDSDELDPRNARAVKAMRRRRWRNVSRSTSMSMEDDSASSVYSSSYRDSWVSLFDPLHASSQTSDWRAMSYDGADLSVDDMLFEGVAKSHETTQCDSSESGLVVVVEPSSSSTDNQIEDHGTGLIEPWMRRRKSSVMIVEELEDDPAVAEAEELPNPAVVT